jgi:nitrogen fixation NifU-like protein
MDHYQHPRNVGVMADASGVGMAENSACGDAMQLYLKIQDDRIKAASFKTYGCPASIAASSILTEILKGLTVDEAREITRQDVANALGGLPQTKVHCSVLAEDAIRAAVQDYERKQRDKEVVSSKQ